MRKQDVSIGGEYLARVSGLLARVRVIREHVSPISGRVGWDALNLKTGREVHVRSAARLRPLTVPDRLTMSREG